MGNEFEIKVKGLQPGEAPAVTIGKKIESEAPKEDSIWAQAGKTAIRPIKSLLEKDQQAIMVIQHMKDGYGIGEAMMIVGITASQAPDITAKVQELLNKGTNAITPEKAQLKENANTATDKLQNLGKSVYNSTSSPLRLYRGASTALKGIYELTSSVFKAEDIMNSVAERMDLKTQQKLAKRSAEFNDVIARDSVVIFSLDKRFEKNPEFQKEVADARKILIMDAVKDTKVDQKTASEIVTKMLNITKIDDEKITKNGLKAYVETLDNDKAKAFAKKAQKIITKPAEDLLPHKTAAKFVKAEKLNNKQKRDAIVTASIVAAYKQAEKAEKLKVNQREIGLNELKDGAVQIQDALQDVTGLAANIKDNINTGNVAVDKTKDFALASTTIVKGAGELLTLDVKKSAKTFTKAADELTFGVFGLGEKKPATKEEIKKLEATVQTTMKKYADSLKGAKNVHELETKLKNAKTNLVKAELAQENAGDEAVVEIKDKNGKVIKKTTYGQIKHDLEMAEQEEKHAKLEGRKAREKAQEEYDAKHASSWLGRRFTKNVDMPKTQAMAIEAAKAQVKELEAQMDIAKTARKAQLSKLEKSKQPAIDAAKKEIAALKNQIKQAKNAQEAYADAKTAYNEAVGTKKTAKDDKKDYLAPLALGPMKEPKITVDQNTGIVTGLGVDPKTGDTYRIDFNSNTSIKTTKSTNAKTGATVLITEDPNNGTKTRVESNPAKNLITTSKTDLNTGITNTTVKQNGEVTETSIAYPDGTKVTTDKNGNEKVETDEKAKAKYNSIKNLEAAINDELKAKFPEAKDDAERRKYLLALVLTNKLKKGDISESKLASHSERIRQMAENGGSAFWNFMYDVSYTDPSNAGKLTAGEHALAIADGIVLGNIKQCMRHPITWIDAVALGFLCPRTATSAALFAIGAYEVATGVYKANDSLDSWTTEVSDKRTGRGLTKIAAGSVLISFHDGDYALIRHDCWGRGKKSSGQPVKLQSSVKSSPTPSPTPTPTPGPTPGPTPTGDTVTTNPASDLIPADADVEPGSALSDAAGTVVETVAETVADAVVSLLHP